MLCRRCGMESSTTDVCEWCNRPMLPPGAAVSGKAAEELKQSGTPISVPDPEAPGEAPGLPLGQEQPEGGEAEPDGDAEEAAEQAAPEVGLRPLGGDGQETPPPGGPSGPGVPSHGLEADATRTSVDISQYVGADESIFRPIVREEAQASGTQDLLAQRRKKGGGRDQADEGPEMSENTRLVRCLAAGLVIGLVFALAQFLITGTTVDVIYSGLRLGRGSSVFTAVKYGIASGLVFGFGLGALLVRFRKGSFLGLLVGIMVGLSLQNGIWSIVPGALSGIVAGRFATIGLRRVVNV